MAVRKIPRADDLRHYSSIRRALCRRLSIAGDESFTVPAEIGSTARVSSPTFCLTPSHQNDLVSQFLRQQPSKGARNAYAGPSR